MDCLFCSIASGEKNVPFRYEDEQAVAFDDIAPKAPTHILIVPKTHLPSVAEMTDADERLVGHLAYIAKQLAEEQGIAEDGYRVLFNTRTHAGQSVDHIHLHLLGGRQLGAMV
ncbi:histidine triad nucleotide-binding protein [Candidatus Berkelbacteria bacterium]|nr:histidine triad nucleotide-binding protein [Candidatus Berkelbacteria bacterium]